MISTLYPKETTTQKVSTTKSSTTQSTTKPSTTRSQSTTESPTTPSQSTTEASTTPSQSTTKSSTTPSQSTTEALTTPSQSTESPTTPSQSTTEASTTPSQSTEASTTPSQSTTESSTPTPPCDCKNPLPVGVSNGVIPDAHMVSNSIRVNTPGSSYTGPSQARLNNKASDSGSGAWEPKDEEGYLEIYFNKLENVAEIRTQGSPTSQKFARRYFLQISLDGKTFDPNPIEMVKFFISEMAATHLPLYLYVEA